MLVNSLPLHILSFIVWLIVVKIAKAKKFEIQNMVLFTLFLVYMNILLSITLFPIPIGNAIDWYRANPKGYNFIPFHTVELYTRMPITLFFFQVCGNVVIMMPFGFLLPFIVKKTMKLPKAMLVFLAASIGIETMQFLIGFSLGIRYRTVDIDDIILNTFGAFLGYVMFRGLKIMLKRR